MHSQNMNIYYELVSTFHWNVVLIKNNNFSMRTTIFKVAQNKFICIRTVTLLNDWMEEFCSFREEFYWYGIWKKADIFSCRIAQIKTPFRIVSEDLINLHQCYLVWEVSLGDKLQYVKLQVRLGKICIEYLQDLFSGGSYFYIY